MNFVEQCIQDNLPFWEQGLHSEFITRMKNGTLSEDCLRGYLVDDSLYLWQYAKVFAWGILHAQDTASLRTFYSFLSFVNEGEGATRVQYLKRYGLTDEQIQHLPQRPQSKAYTTHMLTAAQEGIPECMMASLPCMLSYHWIFCRLLEQEPAVRNTIYWPLVQDYTTRSYDAICQQWVDFGNSVCEGLSQQRLARCREIFRECSRLELGFWEMSCTPREDLPPLK